ncbi:UAF30 [Lepeophtheirus salmonis]|uniref:UAF30 n=1 Tax=Lepeophtheirus salmonis TaxID=72036 RepID=A0A7R8CGA2_LEPSM|nr:UAF30 [Lepeophtheirus salmonis]CAF2774105.1 UAF30 [Lepeophtheirus salmonis]
MPTSRSELKKKVTEILKDADLESTSAKKVRKQLEDDLDMDLTDRKEEVNDIIQEVMDENEEDEEDEGGKQSSDYEPEAAPAPPKKKKTNNSSLFLQKTQR